MKNGQGTCLRIGVAVMLLSAILSLLGLAWPEIYQDTVVLVVQGWWINDWVTLLVAVPLLVAAIFLGKQGAKSGFALLAGVMMYTVYNYSYYLFGAAFNALFPGYVVVFVLGLFGLLTCTVTLFGLLSKEDVPSHRVSRSISTYMVFAAVFLSIGWIGQWLNFVINGIKPPLLEQLGSTNHLVAALDMTFVVPWFLFGAFLLWKQRISGVIVSFMVHVKTVVYNVILIWGSIFQHGAGVEGAAALLPLWGFFLIGSTFSVAGLLHGIEKKRVVFKEFTQQEITADES